MFTDLREGIKGLTLGTLQRNVNETFTFSVNNPFFAIDAQNSLKLTNNFANGDAVDKFLL